MIVVLGVPHGGGPELVRLLQSMGCDAGQLSEPTFLHSTIREVNDELLRLCFGDSCFVDPELLCARLPELTAALGPTARAAIAGASASTLVYDPRLCLTLPFWRDLFADAFYLFVHRDPLEIAHALLTHDGVPLSAALSLWQLHMLSAVHHSRDRSRLLVSFAELEKRPQAVVEALRTFLRLPSDFVLQNAATPLDTRPGPSTHGSMRSMLTLAQRELETELDAGCFPTPSGSDPYARWARDPLILLQQATERGPSALRSQLAAELGRARAKAWHCELRERATSARLHEVEIEHATARAELSELTGLLARERVRTQNQTAHLARLAHQTAELDRVARSRRTVLVFDEDGRKRLSMANLVLRRFEPRMYRQLGSQTGVPYGGVPSAPKLQVLVGTLHSGENEFEQCCASIRKQTYRHLSHETLAGLAKKESIAALWRTFRASGCDLLIKVDADMVLCSPDFVERVVQVFQANRNIDLLSVAIMDFFSGGPIQGINVYRSSAAFSHDRQDSLYTDKTQVPSSKRLVVWPTFARDAIHCPNPSPFQAFHFGVHRGIKVLQPQKPFESARAEEQLAYLEKTWAHFQVRRDARLAFACLGFELAMLGRYELAHLDYTNPFLHRAFREYEQLAVQEVESIVRELRAHRSPSAGVNTLRDRRARLAADPPVRNILALVPHTSVFGDINRFFELAREVERLGVRFTIAQPDPVDEPLAATRRDDYPQVDLQFFSEVIDLEWDVVLCGDALSGLMFTIPFFRSKLAAVYLSNGWEHNRVNVTQIAVVDPDVIIANSSYSAAQHKELAPSVVAGGVDLTTFHPPADRRPRPAGEPFRVCAYPGRRKRRKRFEDTVAACEILFRRGIPIELHAFDQSELSLDVPFPFVFHGAIAKEQVRELLWQMDVMVCAEEDAGWSNPGAEAMACGTPLVCTDAGTLDFAIHEETALVAPSRDPAAMAAAIERLYHDPQLSARLREAGLTRIRSFGWPAVARNLLDVLAAARLDPAARRLKNARALERLQADGTLPQ